MRVPAWQLEGIAAEVHDALGLPCPMDAFVLAAALELAVRGWARGGGSLTGDTVRYPVKARVVRQHFVVAHEIGHWLLKRARIDIGEDEYAFEAEADYLAAVLLLPREVFEADRDRTGWDLFALRDLHPNAPASLIATRLCQLSPAAAATVWDAGRLHRWTGAPDIALDRELVSLALEDERPAREGNVIAWPVLDGRWRRVVVVRRAA